MFHAETLRECLRHNDWARDKLFAPAVGLTDEQLDRPFDIGPGSLRATLRHLYGAERTWFERWQGTAPPLFPPARTLATPEDMWRAYQGVAVARDAALSATSNAGLRETVTYTDEAGETDTVQIGRLLLHVHNHGIHHRAQVLNMWRHLAVRVGGLDYLFFRAEQPTVEWDSGLRDQVRETGLLVQAKTAVPARLSVAALREYYRFSDWAWARVLAAAAVLPDDQLDRGFEMGLGTLRKTLAHIRGAEQWWYENWTNPAPRPFEKLPATTSLRALRDLFDETAGHRNAFLDRAADDDLLRVVTAEARPGLHLRFRVGESMLQVCGHGAHHRAQALNMLRQIGADLDGLDCQSWIHAPRDMDTGAEL